MEELDIFNQIQAVETPPFLLTRIKQRIQEQKEAIFAPRLAWTLGLTFLLVVGLNVAVITKHNQRQAHQSQNLAEGMNLLPNNTLYNTNE